ILRWRDGFDAGPWAAQALGFDAVPGMAQVLDSVFLGHERALLDRLVPALLGSGPADRKAGLRLDGLAVPGAGALAAFEDVFLYGATAKAPFQAKTDRFPTKPVRAALADILPQLEQLMLRVEAAREPRLAAEVLARTEVLHDFARTFLAAYEAAKLRLGWLDFDDLIARAHRLLTDSAVAAWVLFRLDGGIDHILVDEAQDTSPLQWKVIERLAQEFTSGAGARAGVTRTIFVVGDKKQSIYSFQGADVGAFDEKRDFFAKRLQGVDQPLRDLRLEYSFRSAPVILRLVDATFPDKQLAALGGEMRHIAFREDMPGRIDLWPVFEPAENPEPPEWYDPVDVIGQEHHANRLARRLAETIHDLITTGHPVPGKDGMRPCHAGDFLILVRRRSQIFNAVITACKAAGLPIAGADRLKLGAELAVKDIRALLAFLATAEDDLSLAAALRSPLLGWSERELFALAHGREGSLWENLRKKTEAGETLRILTDLRDQADFFRPYDLIERLLTRHDGRKRLLARLGAEAEDGIDELLSQALAYERAEVPSLTGFLCWLENDDVEVKRQMDGTGDRIRVMTVHGAKGLEAPIVILPDTAPRQLRDRGEIAALPGNPVWKMPADQAPDLLNEYREAQREKDIDESMRLLYVAMTRAQSWLIVAAAGKMTAGENAPPVWYDLIRDGMARLDAEATNDGGLRLLAGNWGSTLPRKARQDNRPPTQTPDWALQPAPEAKRPAQPVNPSRLGGAKALPGDLGPPEENAALQDAAMARGTRLHLLLEHLPQYDECNWPRMARNLLPGAEDVDALLQEAGKVLRDPGLSPLFGADTLSEVDITAKLGSHTMLGTIDRLIVKDDHILAVDFKSNHLVPEGSSDVPEGLLRQMGAYGEALGQIWPNRRIDLALLWTRHARLMMLDPDSVKAALGRATFP
ncbi:MAG: double-strand break repair helicase AddA, partial [Pseudorhodobacter sp.]